VSARTAAASVRKKFHNHCTADVEEQKCNIILASLLDDLMKEAINFALPWQV